MPGTKKEEGKTYSSNWVGKRAGQGRPSFYKAVFFLS